MAKTKLGNDVEKAAKMTLAVTRPLLHLTNGKYRHSGLLDMFPCQLTHEAHRLGLQAIEMIAVHMYGRPFQELGQTEQDRVLKTIHDADPPAAQETWQKMSVHRFWLLLMQDVLDA